MEGNDRLSLRRPLHRTALALAPTPALPLHRPCVQQRKGAKSISPHFAIPFDAVRTAVRSCDTPLPFPWSRAALLPVLGGPDRIIRKGELGRGRIDPRPTSGTLLLTSLITLSKWERRKGELIEIREFGCSSKIKLSFRQIGPRLRWRRLRSTLNGSGR